MTFRILRKTKKIYLTPNNIVYSIILICIIPVFFKYRILNDTNYQLWDKTLVKIMALSFIGGIIFSLFKINSFKTLKGEFIGVLEFKSKEILVDQKIYTLDNISKIEISAWDYRGMSSTYNGNLDGNKSNGVENKLKLILNDNQKINIDFEQYYEDQILEVKDLLIEYCNAGKLNYKNLISNLKISDYKEIQEFKKKHLKQFQ